MPVFAVKASRVGRFFVSSSTSMYSGQFDQLTFFSVALRSFAAWSLGATFWFVPAVPHAARPAATAAPPTPCSSVRRDTSPRSRAGEMVPGVGSVMGARSSFVSSVVLAGSRGAIGAEDGAVPLFPGSCGRVVHDVLHVGVLVEGVRGHVLPEPGGLVAPVRHLADDRDVVVHPDAAGPD